MYVCMYVCTCMCIIASIHEHDNLFEKAYQVPKKTFRRSARSKKKPYVETISAC